MDRMPLAPQEYNYNQAHQYMSQIKYTLFIYNCIQHPKGHRKSILKTYYMDAQN